MWTRLIVISAFCFVAALAASTKSTRPNPCPVDTTYTKDCNTCQCGATPSKDKCSQRDCARLSATSTERPSSTERPGVCPTRVTPAPGSNACEKRGPHSSNCSKDKDCTGAKKCCVDGCNNYLCRQPIYNYVNGTRATRKN
ncbi:unnamed protein product [Allacma fusca]|uniref:WAP domain-containing protein n=1 Tax=Allacma fusca TaxID=39272 RepID=A0A8J2JQW3_9HEXA|nr:unnamed protein product [Allacma fusca]